MPIYEYHCDSCGHDFEYLVFGKDTPDCISCSSSKINRRVSACGFISKGRGGETTRTAAADSSCSGCSTTSCASCGH